MISVIIITSIGINNPDRAYFYHRNNLCHPDHHCKNQLRILNVTTTHQAPHLTSR